MNEVYDDIIVGAGSSGCVLANRLSADPQRSVLLLEAGGVDSSFLIRIPKGIGKLVMNPHHAWHFAVEQPRAADIPASEAWVRGKGLGGSSSINGMIYTRGQPQDYDAWEIHGGSGWNWSTMKAAFKAIEDHELGADDVRGARGPLHISTGKFRYPLAEQFIQAGEQMGLTRKDDLNREDQEGVGYYAHTIKNGRRISAADAFLKPAASRKNLRVITRANVARVLIENQRAVGVVVDIDGKCKIIRARGEIILAAGTLLSPKILQLSGVGAAESLQALGIDVVVDSPAVGAHLREHLGMSLPYRLQSDPGNNARFYGVGLAKSILQYLLLRSGPLATGPFEIGAFARTTTALERPDVQLYLAAFTFALSDDNFPVPLSDVEHLPGATIYGQLLQPTSEGSLQIQSSDPAAPLAIKPNWLTTQEDQRAVVAMVRYMRSYMSQPAIAPYLAEELVPGANCQSDEDVLQACRRLSLCGLHAVGTCRMGSDNTAVVDSRLRVRGVDGLRVVDCSVMPGLVSGNTNGPAMALAWRASELIIADRKT